MSFASIVFGASQQSAGL